MGWIKNRINREKSKHEGRLDWAELAETKIISTLKDKLNRLEHHWADKCELCGHNLKEMPVVIKDDVIAALTSSNIQGKEK